MTTRAIHIELVSSLTTDSAIMAIRRMIARRGCPAKIYSDNGTNFRGADAELRKAATKMDNKIIEGAKVSIWILYHLQARISEAVGNAWYAHSRLPFERLNERALRAEVLLTLLAEAEHSINSRPSPRVPSR